MIAPAFPPQEAPPLIDRFGRRLDYLRISVTDRCNLRCVYCMPPEGIELYARECFLTFEEIERIVQVAASVGVEKIRLTGGEPLVRRGIEKLVRMIAAVPGIRAVSMTTNGIRLQALAQPLVDAGLSSINVSLDSLYPERYRRVTGGGDFDEAWNGITAARGVGLPVKLNAVALEDLSPAEAFRFVRLAIGQELEVRFIEFMPLCGAGWKHEKFVPLRRLEEAIGVQFALEPFPSDGAARVFRVKDTGGRVGFISSMSEPFCAACSRLRMTATGLLRPCLFSPMEEPLMPVLRGGGSDDDLREAFRRATSLKPRQHGTDTPGAGIPENLSCLIRSVGG